MGDDQKPLATKFDFSDDYTNVLYQSRDSNHEILPGRVKFEYEPKVMFGLGDASHENIEDIKDYSIYREDCKEFFDESNVFRVICAPKGTGKTTICRLWSAELDKKKSYVSKVIFESQVISLMPRNNDLAGWILAWKKVIVSAALSKVGYPMASEVSDIIELINRHEERGYQRKDLVELVHEYISKNSQVFDTITESINDTENLFDSNRKIWMFIDEVDQNFVRTSDCEFKVAGLLIACREMTGYIKNLFIRTTIKPTVWSLLVSKMDSLAPIRDLMVIIEWNNEQILSLMARRIEIYLLKNKIISDTFPDFSAYSHVQKEEWLHNQVFANDWELGHGHRHKRRPAHKIFRSLSMSRPRWILNLCRTAAEKRNARYNLITGNDVEEVLRDYGSHRIGDIAAEFQFSCNHISEIIYLFAGAKSRYSLIELLDYINQVVIAKLSEDNIKVKITGITDNAKAIDIANLLYEIEFIEPKQLNESGEGIFLHFSTYPDLIKNNVVNGHLARELYWEINTPFREILLINKPKNSDIFPNKTDVKDLLE